MGDPNEPNNGGDLHELGQCSDVHQVDLRPGYVVEFDEGASPVLDSTWGVIRALFDEAE